ncbi:hypothetical protein [Sphingomonas alpina]|uniref:hypothetical protein n=1 Tax=Sphingomonas alpina TaxID=653931 RepID=UPI001E4B7547|nr:hypothetical protein [Sphingomonas alpina]
MIAGFTLIATGCAERSKGPYPSLLPRPIESRGDAEPVVAPVALEPDPALDRRITEVGATINTAKKDFATAATRAQALAKAAQGQAVGSDRWIEAQTALAELDAFRATSSAALTDLEDATIARAAAGKPPYPSLEAARDAAQAELDLQTKRIETLQASMPAV